MRDTIDVEIACREKRLDHGEVVHFDGVVAGGITDSVNCSERDLNRMSE
jgi:hypothetical protein